MHMGHRTVTEPAGVSTKTGMQRLHPLQRTTCTKLRDRAGTERSYAAPFQTRGRQAMKTSEGRYARRVPHTLHRTRKGSEGTPRVRLGTVAPQSRHFTRAWRV